MKRSIFALLLTQISATAFPLQATLPTIAISESTSAPASPVIRTSFETFATPGNPVPAKTASPPPSYNPAPPPKAETFPVMQAPVTAPPPGCRKADLSDVEMKTYRPILGTLSQKLHIANNAAHASSFLRKLFIVLEETSPQNQFNKIPSAYPRQRELTAERALKFDTSAHLQFLLYDRDDSGSGRYVSEDQPIFTGVSGDNATGATWTGRVKYSNTSAAGIEVIAKYKCDVIWHLTEITYHGEVDGVSAEGPRVSRNTKLDLTADVVNLAGRSQRKYVYFLNGTGELEENSAAGFLTGTYKEAQAWRNVIVAHEILDYLGTATGVDYLFPNSSEGAWTVSKAFDARSAPPEQEVRLINTGSVKLIAAPRRATAIDSIPDQIAALNELKYVASYRQSNVMKNNFALTADHTEEGNGRGNLPGAKLASHVFLSGGVKFSIAVLKISPTGRGSVDVHKMYTGDTAYTYGVHPVLRYGIKILPDMYLENGPWNVGFFLRATDRLAYRFYLTSGDFLVWQKCFLLPKMEQTIDSLAGRLDSFWPKDRISAPRKLTRSDLFVPHRSMNCPGY